MKFIINDMYYVVTIIGNMGSVLQQDNYENEL